MADKNTTTTTFLHGDKASWAGRTVAEAQNPVTRSMVRLYPPFTPESDADFDRFYEWFTKWCQAMWALGLIDPSEFFAQNGWAHAVPTDSPSAV